MRIINVNTSKKYAVTVCRGTDGLGAALSVIRGKNVAIISDDVVLPLYGESLKSALTDKTVHTFAIPHGERGKCAEVYFRIMNGLAERGFTRGDGVVALGGGVVGDLAGFCASTYMRGITLVQIPTTLLAAVDSSVGGKTAINLDRGKNLCGTFYQPSAVFVNADYLKTLPEREIRCGEGEILKYAFLSKALTPEMLARGDEEEIIATCVEIKAEIVGRDEKERGERKLLNLGHTIGHALERLYNFEITHGECVAKGLYAALKISAVYYGFDKETFERAKSIVTMKGHDLSIDFSADKLFGEIIHDKKRDDDGLDMVLIDSGLSARIVRMPLARLKEALRWIY